MSYPTHPERLKRIGRDNDDPDDTVFVVRGESRPTRGIYHERKTCESVDGGKEWVRMPRKKAQERVKAPCLICVLEEAVYGDNGGKGGKSKLERLIESGKVPEERLSP